MVGACPQPVSGAHRSAVHGLSSPQSSAIARHLPALHVSLVVHLSASVHGAVLAVQVQPTLVSHASSVHALSSSQSVVSLTAHAPATQAEVLLHTLPSSQGAPSSRSTGVHAPESGRHSAFLQPAGSSGAHCTSVVGFTAHLPVCVLQNSVPLQRLPSSMSLQCASTVQSHTLPTALHEPAAQRANVHTWPSSQARFSPVGSFSHTVPWPLVTQVLWMQVVSPSVGHVLTVPLLTSQRDLPSVPALQNRVPLQRSPSSLAAQSASSLHSHWLVPGAQTPDAQPSPWVQSLPSVHVAASGSATTAHLPVAGAQAVFWHAVSSTVWQMTTEAGLVRHFWVFGSQYEMPLQRSPSSLSAQSASPWHGHTPASPEQTPLPSQVSPAVHALPSVQVTPSASDTSSQAPVFGAHLFAEHGRSLAGQEITVLGFTAQVCGSACRSQNSVPLQALSSSFAAQSAWLSHSHALGPPLHCPLPSHASACVHGLPSSHATVGSLLTLVHVPVLAVQALVRHTVSLAVEHTMTVAGSRTHL